MIAVGDSMVVTLTFNLMLIPSLFSKYFRDKTWCVWKEILWNIWILTSIVLGYVLYHTLFGVDIFAFSVFWILKIVLLASIPIAILIAETKSQIYYDEKLNEYFNKILSAFNKEIVSKSFRSLSKNTMLIFTKVCIQNTHSSDKNGHLWCSKC
jgi:hypothetical protein